MPISQDQIVGLTKQVFILEYLLNGLFPCQSDVVRLIRAKKREWKFNDKFEYRMLLATTNTGGTLNSQLYKESVGLIRPGNLEYGTYHATYGTVTDGFDVDMMLNLETKEKRASFENDYATRMHSLRTNVASLFKNFAIHGQYGVVHQIRDSILKPNIDDTYNPVNNVSTTAPTQGLPFTIKVPINVFNSNFKRGKLLIKTTGTTPWSSAKVNELYMVIDNQPGLLALIPLTEGCTPWSNGQFLEVAHNREISQDSNAFLTGWGVTTTLNIPNDGPGSAYNGTNWTAFSASDSLFYTNGTSSVVGAMEGLADLFPWYHDPTAVNPQRLGLDMPFRDQPNRLNYSTEQAGGWVFQGVNEHIIDVIMRGSFLTKSTVPYAEIGIWLNPITRAQMGYEEGDQVKVIRDNFVAGPIVYQRGVKSTDYQIGNQVVKEVVEDLNMPTDVIIIGPKDDLSYNCWDNSIFEIDNYIQETWGKSEPPKIEDISIPEEFIAKLDLSNRVTFGSPTLSDGSFAQGFANSGVRIRHPKNRMPIALHEMGALFTEYPYTYTIVKLREPIVDLTTS